MRFSTALSFVLAALVAGAVADPQGNKGGAGAQAQAQQGGNKGANNNNNNGGTATSNGGNTAASSAAAAAAAASGNNAANNGGNNNAGGDAQDSTTLDPSVIATGFALDGNQSPAAGQSASLTSKNNFINFCLTTNQPITNGQQIKTGSCNPAPMGQIAPTTAMPASKFVNPPNGGNIAANQDFTVSMAIQNIQTGVFVNANSNYYSAPQQLNAQNQIIGHTHIYIQQLQSLDQTTPLDPNTFAFFKGIDDAAQNGVVTADVTGGLPAGSYRMGSINSAANHQPVLVAVAQHGALDDMVYFTVGGNGNANANNGTATGNANGNANATGNANGNANANGNNNQNANAGGNANAGAAGGAGAAGANGAQAGAGAAAGGNKNAAGGAGAAAAGAGAKGAAGGKRTLRFAREIHA